MTRLEWVIVVALVAVLGLLIWRTCPGWPLEAAPTDPLEERLDRIERQLDFLLRQEAPPPAPRAPAVKPRARRGRGLPPILEPSIFVPLEPPLTPRPADGNTAATGGGSRPAQRWTWAEVEAWRVFRQTAKD